LSAAAVVLGGTSALAMLFGGCSSSNGISGGSPDAGKDGGKGPPGDASDAGAPAPSDGSLPNVPDNVSIAAVASCAMDGIGATKLLADAAAAIVDVSMGSTGSTGPADASQLDKPYCLVKVRVDPQVNIWVALPMSNWNGRIRAEGGGGYSGLLSVATDSVEQDFVGIKTDTGHPSDPPAGLFDGSFGMLSPGVPNTPLQIDFAYRSEHLMAVIGKQLVRAFYGQPQLRTYWYGCSTGGRQGLMMAQHFPDDFDAILAGAPAIHWDRFQAYQIWPQMVMSLDVGAPIASAKLALATQKAIASCDAADGVTDGLIDDPRNCSYKPSSDTTITTASCTAQDTTCLTAAEATAIEKIWGGSRNTTGTLLWPGVERGADLTGLAGAMPFPIATAQPKFWVYLDASWDWKTLTYQGYEDFFDKTVEKVGPVIASDDPNLAPFATRGGKLLLYHGWADQLIMPQGTTRYFEAVGEALGASVSQFAKLYMVPGMAHCSGGPGPNRFGNVAGDPNDADHNIFRALMAWSERAADPKAIIATKYNADDPSQGVMRTRPLCPYPTVARYKGSGSMDDAASFACMAAQ
jgi:pimeloyl-ACP methyl ester carboxylesterase